MANKARIWSFVQIAALSAIVGLCFTAQRSRFELVQGRDASDFPFAMEAGRQPALAQPRTMQLEGLTPAEEPKAADNPIGVAEAAKILKDSEIFEKSKGSDAMDSWKAAVKNSGPAIIQDVTDDATAYNPFPKQSLSDKMEIEDVWNKARALAKPAGEPDRLDGDAKTAKKAIENAESQADASAYMAANEAAAVDAYDVSIPNVDMMARNKVPKVMAGRALARTHSVPLTHQALSPTPKLRVQALAQLPRAATGADSVLAAARQSALAEVQAQRQRLAAISAEMREVQGREEEAQHLAEMLSSAQPSSAAGSGGGSSELARARAAAMDDVQAHRQRLAVLEEQAQDIQGREEEAQRLAATLGAAPPSGPAVDGDGEAAPRPVEAAAAAADSAAADKVARLRRKVTQIKRELAAAADSLTPGAAAAAASPMPAAAASASAAAATAKAAGRVAPAAKRAAPAGVPKSATVADTFAKALRVLPLLAVGISDAAAAAVTARPAAPRKPAAAAIRRTTRFDKPAAAKSFASVFGFDDTAAPMPRERLAKAAV